jgi:Na+/melibiose symporter-like transporter
MTDFPAGASDGLSQRVVDAHDVARAVVLSQTLFTAGHVLTTGGFLYYFANALHPSALLFSVLLVIPEISQGISLWARPVIQRCRGRKRTWLLFFLLARGAALAIPAMAVPSLRPDDSVAFWIIVASLAVSQGCQSIAYVAYLSWLSDLVPRVAWGGFFGLRRIAHVSVMLFLPAVAALLRGNWSDWLNDDGVRLAYVAVFLAGGGLLLLSMLPLLRIPDVPMRWSAAQPRWRDAVRAVAASSSLRGVVASSLWLAFFQGLTQSAMFRYQTSILGLSLEAWFLLGGVMYMLQIPMSWLGGFLSDRTGDKQPLIASLLLVSLAMPFWLAARPGRETWLLGAYAVWGLFGIVNICQRNLLLRLAPASDNAVPIAVFEHLAALLAGLAGLLGGWALDRMLLQQESAFLTPFHILFVISWMGRASAAAWLLGVREPSRTVR